MISVYENLARAREVRTPPQVEFTSLEVADEIARAAARTSVSTRRAGRGRPGLPSADGTK